MSKQAITAMIAALEPMAGTKTVTGIESDNFKRWIESADTPARLILPSNEGEVHTLTPTGTGRTSQMEWIIKDLLLYRPVEEGMGWLEIGYALDDYCDSYAEKLVAVNHATTGFCSIPAEVQQIDFLVGVHQFPRGGRSYYGVLVTLRVLEYIK